MKTRNGFVSNSSSSSFIIGFDKRPGSVEEIQKLLFGDFEYLEYGGESFKTRDIAEIIFNDIKKNKAIPASKLHKKVKEDGGWFPGRPQYDHTHDELSDKLIKQFHKSFPQYKGDYHNIDKIDELMAKQLAQKIKDAQKKEWDEYKKEIDIAFDKFIKEKVIPIMNDKKVYIVSYSDNDGQAHIEHGNVFSNISHIQISHH